MDLGAVVAELKASTDTFGPLVRRQAEAFPDRVALAFEHDALTYGTYNDEVNRLAHCLRHAGVRRGEPVAILCANSPLFLASIGAVAKLGAIGALVGPLELQPLRTVGGMRQASEASSSAFADERMTFGG